jgi:hypothetical protein
MKHLRGWKIFKTALFSPWSIAAIVTLLVIIFFDTDAFDKYRLDLISQGAADKTNGFEYYIDTDRDGNSERVVLFNNTEGRASVKIIGSNGFIRDHFYFDGKILNDHQSLSSSVIDSSGRVAIFLITERNDSLMLQVFYPTGNKEIICRDRFLVTKDRENGKRDFALDDMLFTDLNRDGYKEVVLTFLAGFRLQPRVLLIYQPATGVLQTTPLMGSYQMVSDTADLDGDGNLELLLHSYAIGNHPDTTTVPYDDHRAWLMVLDHHLNFKFPPVGFKKRYLALTCKALTAGGKMRIAALYNGRSAGAGPPKLMVFDHMGVLLKERVLDDTSHIRDFTIFVDRKKPDRLWLFREGGIAEEYDTSLTLIQKRVVKDVKHPGYLEMQLDEVSGNELVFYGGADGAVVVARSGFRDFSTIELGFSELPLYFNVAEKVDKPSSLVVQRGTHTFHYLYHFNLFYYLRWVIYAGIYSIILGFIFFIRYLQRKSLTQRYLAEKEVASLQLMLLNNQLDPHFTFNAINSISASILRERPAEANQNLLNLSKLMRSCVSQSNRLSRSLAEELEFLQHYIDLLRGRMERPFEYKLAIAPEVDLQWQVPRMVTQIYAENAIKHGLKPLTHGGVLTVRATSEKRNLLLAIEDNGVGRRSAAGNGSSGTGKGMAIIQEAIAIINKFNRQQITVVIHDLTDEKGQSSGTRITLTIPAEMNYSFYES